MSFPDMGGIDFEMVLAEMEELRLGQQAACLRAMLAVGDVKRATELAESTVGFIPVAPAQLSSRARPLRQRAAAASVPRRIRVDAYIDELKYKVDQAIVERRLDRLENYVQGQLDYDDDA